MAHFILTPFGTSGDVNPFIWMGRLLQGQGHEVTFITFEGFRGMVEKAGLTMDGVGDEDLFEQMAQESQLWKPIFGTWLVFEQAVKWSPIFFEKIENHLRKDSVIVAPFPQFGARMIREKYGNALVTTHLQPICFLSSYDTPVFFKGGAWAKKLPIWLKDLFKKIPSPVDALLLERLHAWMNQRGIPKPKKLFPEWFHSPDANLALFPEWFAQPQLDWPMNLVCAGFPLEDLHSQYELPENLMDWLKRGDKPILFSPGTGNAQAARFFEEALKACEILKVRAIFGTRFADQLPSPLPPWVWVVDYLPFSALMPHVACAVHHGGIGTMSQALAAGLPQLIMPFAHDQPDNADRLKRLGLGDYLYASDFYAKEIAKKLESLLHDTEMKQKIDQMKSQLRHKIPTQHEVSVSPAAQKVLELLELVAEEGGLKVSSQNLASR